MDTFDDDQHQGWGAKVNTQNPFDPRQRQPCPPWANWKQKQKWSQRGLIVWNHAAQQLIRLYPLWALDVLEQLRLTTDWPHAGITIGEQLSISGPTVNAQGT